MGFELAASWGFELADSRGFELTGSWCFDLTGSWGFELTGSWGFELTGSWRFELAASKGFELTGSWCFDPAGSWGFEPRQVNTPVAVRQSVAAGAVADTTKPGWTAHPVSLNNSHVFVCVPPSSSARVCVKLCESE